MQALVTPLKQHGSDEQFEDEPDFPREIDDNWPVELGADYCDVFELDDDYEPAPQYGDFWTEDLSPPDRRRIYAAV